MSDFTNQQVKKVSDFIQSYMRENNIALMTADECAELLAKSKLLMNTVGPQPGFNFRQMLRDGRDGHINIVAGACQETPRAKWYIYSLSANDKRKNENAELVAELTYLFDNELVSKGKKQLSLRAANEILKSEEGFSDIDLKSLLESGNFPQAYQTERKPKQWHIGFSKPDKYKERRTEFLKNSSQVEPQILSNNTRIDNTQYKVWIIVIVIVAIAGIYKLSTTPSIQNSSNNRKETIERQFSSWDGSHINLTNYIKQSMNDPNSYEHVETSYSDYGTYLIVITTYRGKNAFGGTVTETVKAKVDLNGNVLNIIE